MMRPQALSQGDLPLMPYMHMQERWSIVSTCLTNMTLSGYVTCCEHFICFVVTLSMLTHLL